MQLRFLPLACVLLLTLEIVGCQTEATLSPDSVFFNGQLVTVDDDFSIVEAVAVRKGRIVAVGSDEEVRALAGSGTRLVDLEGHTVLPGFYDNHNHIGAGNLDPRIQNWRDISSKEELFAAVRERAAAIPEGDWIIGSLRNENMPQSRLPDRWELDEAAPDHPVFLRRGHISLANSLALREAGIDRDTPQPGGGAILKNEDGEPIGWQRESAGHRQVSSAIPPPPPADPEVGIENISRELEELLPYGITSVNIPGMRPRDLHWIQDVYERYGDRLPRATAQVRIRPGYDSYDDLNVGVRTELDTLEGLTFRTGFGNDQLKLGAIKMSIDGGFSAAGFWTIPGYPDRPDYHGVIRIPEETFYRVAKRGHDLGWQLGIHAIGDGAIRMVVDVMDRILDENPRDDHRHYIHHFSVMPPEETLEKVAENDIIVASQPNFTYSLGPYNASPGLTPERLQTNNPQKTLLDRGIRVSYGSDGMPTGPLVGIYAVVTRKGVDGKVYGPGERVSMEDAIRAYTIGSAYQTFDEDERGSLEMDKYADMVVLGRDILTIDPDSIMEIPIEATIIGGETVFSSGALSDLD